MSINDVDPLYEARKSCDSHVISGHTIFTFHTGCMQYLLERRSRGGREKGGRKGVRKEGGREGGGSLFIGKHMIDTSKVSPTSYTIFLCLCIVMCTY